MDYGFNGCDHEMGPILRNKSNSDFRQIIEDDVARRFIGFTIDEQIGVGNMIISLEAGCKSPVNQSLPLYLISNTCSRDGK